VVDPSDIGALAVIQYAVEVLKVKDILVVGHYMCGGIRASLTKRNHGPLEGWLSKIRRTGVKYYDKLKDITNIDEQVARLS